MKHRPHRSSDKKRSPAQQPAGDPGGPSRRDVLSFALITGGVIAAAGYFLWPMIRQSRLALAPTERRVAISMSGFAPNRMTARVGQEIRLQLVNKDNALHTDGGGWHQFAIDELGLDFKVAPLTVSNVSFTVNEPGIYDYYCGVCCGGRANPFMHGSLVVEA